MLSKIITVKNAHGMHLRMAALIVQTARRYKSTITFYQNGKQASAHSILELLILGARQKSQITVVSDGEEEKEALKKIEMVFIDGAGI